LFQQNLNHRTTGEPVLGGGAECEPEPYPSMGKKTGRGGKKQTPEQVVVGSNGEPHRAGGKGTEKRRKGKKSSDADGVIDWLGVTATHNGGKQKKQKKIQNPTFRMKRANQLTSWSKKKGRTAGKKGLYPFRAKEHEGTEEDPRAETGTGEGCWSRPGPHLRDSSLRFGWRGEKKSINQNSVV